MLALRWRRGRFMDVQAADKCGPEAVLVLQPWVSTTGRWMNFEVMSCRLLSVLGSVEMATVWIKVED